MSTAMDIPSLSRSSSRSSTKLMSPASSFPSRGGYFRTHSLTRDQQSYTSSHSSSYLQQHPEAQPLLQDSRRAISPWRDEERGRKTVTTSARVAAKVSLWQEVRQQCMLAGPMVCVNLLQYSITIVATAFVGHLGELELASASIATSLAGVLGYYVLLGMGSALETLCGQAYGAGEIHYHMLGIYLQRALVVLYLACIPLSFVFLYMENLLLLLGQSPGIAEKAGEYSLFLLPSLFGYALLQPVVKFLQTQSVVIPMLVSSATTLLLHVGLSYALIYQIGLGYRGAAIATSLSFWLNAVLLVLYVKCSGVCKETWNGFSREAFVDLDEFLSLAVPSCIMIWSKLKRSIPIKTSQSRSDGRFDKLYLFLIATCAVVPYFLCPLESPFKSKMLSYACTFNCLEYWCFELLVLLAGLLPNPQLELSALSICLSTTSLNYMIPFGLSAAASTRVSNELGAHDGQAAKRAVYIVMSVSVIQAAIISSILLALRHHWGWLFSSEAEVVNYVAVIMPYLACIALLDGIQGVLSGVARGCGWQELGAIINLGAFYGVGVPTSVLLAFVFKFGGKGLFAGLLCGLATQTAVLSFVTWRTDWEEQVQIASARVEHDEHEISEKIEDQDQ